LTNTSILYEKMCGGEGPQLSIGDVRIISARLKLNFIINTNISHTKVGRHDSYSTIIAGIKLLSL